MSAHRRWPGPDFRRRSTVLAAAVLLAVGGLTFLPPESDPASAFGTTPAQGSEHQYITQVALGCKPGQAPDGSCFEPQSLASLAGAKGSLGAVGTPDITEVLNPDQHCDNADFLPTPGYVPTRDEATATFHQCVHYLRGQFNNGVATADDLANADGSLAEGSTDLGCNFVADRLGSTKCQVLADFGRVLHGIQDFYAHSNWTDASDPTRPLGPDNPPGLGLSAPSTLLNLAADNDPPVPPDFTTGYFIVFAAPFDCAHSLTFTHRVTHACLNKDEETINPETGAVDEAPGALTTERGSIIGANGRTNAANAVAGAITETRTQWQSFHDKILDEYPKTGRLILDVLTRDARQ
jgi:hypothetical protein